jgi:hypothetical protein
MVGGVWRVERPAVNKGKCLKRIFLTLTALALLALPISNATAQDASYELQNTFNQYQQAYYNQQAEYQWSAQLVAHAQTLVGKRTGQCVTSIRTYFGVPKSEVQGLAKNTKINSQTGKVGAIVVFKRMSWAGHVGYQITPVDSSGNFQYFDSNGDGGRYIRGRWVWDEKAKIRTINIKDPRISGYRIYR